MDQKELQSIMSRSAFVVIVLVLGFMFFTDNPLTKELALMPRFIGFVTLTVTCSVAARIALKKLKP